MLFLARRMKNQLIACCFNNHILEKEKFKLIVQPSLVKGHDSFGLIQINFNSESFPANISEH